LEEGKERRQKNRGGEEKNKKYRTQKGPGERMRLKGFLIFKIQNAQD